MARDGTDTYRHHKPHKGDPLAYMGKPAGRILRTEGAIAWSDYGEPGNASCFIWCFQDGLNKLHDWPAKETPRHHLDTAAADQAAYYGLTAEEHSTAQSNLADAQEDSEGEL